MASVLLSGTTYMILYWRELLSGSQRLPGLVMSLSVKRLSQLAVRWLRILKSVIKGLPVALSITIGIGFIAALAVATWKVVDSSLSVGAKVAIAIFAIWSPITLLPVFLSIFWFKRHKSYPAPRYHYDPGPGLHDHDMLRPGEPWPDSRM